MYVYICIHAGMYVREKVCVFCNFDGLPTAEPLGLRYSDSVSDTGERKGRR